MRCQLHGRGGLAVVAAIVLAAGCTTVPETGRSQFNIMSPNEEAQLGLSSFEQMKKEVPISKDPALNGLVQKVGKRIAAVAQLPNAQWEFVVFESKEANAFCLPGGKVGIYTGILPVTQDESGLATVIGHEVGHAVARHGGERMSQEMVRQGLGTAANAAVTSADPRFAAVAGTVYGLGSELGVMLPYSRAHESEADHLGLIFMARAGYDPAGAVAFWQRFAQFKGAADATPTIFRTHPTDQNRIQRIQEWLPEVKKEYRPQ